MFLTLSYKMLANVLDLSSPVRTLDLAVDVLQPRREHHSRS